jgi:hypothetical protein
LVLGGSILALAFGAAAFFRLGGATLNVFELRTNPTAPAGARCAFPTRAPRVSSVSGAFFLSAPVFGAQTISRRFARFFSFERILK